MIHGLPSLCACAQLTPSHHRTKFVQCTIIVWVFKQIYAWLLQYKHDFVRTCSTTRTCTTSQTTSTDPVIMVIFLPNLCMDNVDLQLISWSSCSCLRQIGENKGEHHQMHRHHGVVFVGTSVGCLLQNSSLQKPDKTASFFFDAATQNLRMRRNQSSSNQICTCTTEMFVQLRATTDKRGHTTSDFPRGKLHLRLVLPQARTKSVDDPVAWKRCAGIEISCWILSLMFNLD